MVNSSGVPVYPAAGNWLRSARNAGLEQCLSKCRARTLKSDLPVWCQTRR